MAASALSSDSIRTGLVMRHEAIPGLRATSVLFHSVTGQGDALQAVAFAKFRHQVVAAAVGQTDVGNDNVELLFASGRARLRERSCGGDFIATTGEQFGERCARRLVASTSKMRGGSALAPATVAVGKIGSGLFAGVKVPAFFAIRASGS